MCCARCTPASTSCRPTSSCSPSTARSCGRRARARVQLRFEGAVAGVVPVIRVLQESLAAAHVERIHGIVNGTPTTSSSEMAAPGSLYEQALLPGAGARLREADPTDDVTGRDAAAKMAILARLAFSTPGAPRPGRLRGIEHITADDMAYADELGLGLKLIGHGRARRRGSQRARASAFLYGEHPLATSTAPSTPSPSSPTSITEITMSGPGAGRPADASAVLGDVISCDDPARLDAGDDRRRCRSSSDIDVGVLPAHGGRSTAPRARAIAEILGHAGASIKSFVAARSRRQRAPVMVLHPLLESRLYARADDRPARLHARSRRARLSSSEARWWPPSRSTPLGAWWSTWVRGLPRQLGIELLFRLHAR